LKTASSRKSLDTEIPIQVQAYLYRAIDRSDALVDVMFSEHRDMAAAKAFFQSAKRSPM
jgi:transposase-like protein